MSTRLDTLLLASSLLLVASACRDPIPCPDCDEVADQDDGPTPDLPCDGADLMTDSLNCGACGNECTIWFEGSDYSTGSCNDGVCGPRWSPCHGEGLDPYLNCGELCAAYGWTCAPQGCVGYTAAMFWVDFDGGGCDLHDYDPYETMTGSCEEPIPYMPDPSYSSEVRCCCDDA